MHKKIFKLTIFISLILFIGYFFGKNFSALAAEETGSVSFSWPISVDSQKIATFDLYIDDELFISSVTNRPTQSEKFDLVIDPKNSTYELIVKHSMPLGEHLWKIYGFDSELNQIIQTDPQSIFIRENSQLGLIDYIGDLAQETHVLNRTFDQLIQSALLLLTGVFAIIFAFLYILQFSQILTVGAFAQTLEVFGLIKINNPQGTVFDSLTYEPIPFAIITVESLSSGLNDDKKIKETLVSGSDGMYRGIKLPVGMYRFKVHKDGYSFPTLKNRSPSSSVNDFYKGEVITVNNKVFSQQLMIPLDSLEGAVINTSLQKQRLFKNKINFLMHNLRKSFNKIMLVLWGLSILTVIFVPTIFNTIILLVYTILAFISTLRYLRQPIISGKVIDEDLEPMAAVIVRLIDIESNQLVAVTQTNNKGEFRFFVKKDRYQVSIFKNNYLRDVNDARHIFSLEEIDATKKVAPLLLKMRRATQTIEDFFAQ